MSHAVVLRDLLVERRLQLSLVKSESDLGTGEEKTGSTRNYIIIPGNLSSVSVLALSDIGADTDLLSLSFVQRHSIPLDKMKRRVIALPTGKQIRSVGQATSPFAFDGEPTTYLRTFEILTKCIQDVVLGKPFLSLTSTLTKFAHRITQVRRYGFQNRVLLLGNGPQEIVVGKLNDQRVSAFPDTGSDATIMSKAYALSCGFRVLSGPIYRQRLQFSESSEAKADGVVDNVEWAFGDDCRNSKHCIDRILVLDRLPFDVILGGNFLLNTRTYELHQDCFYESSDDISDNAYLFNLIREVEQDKQLGRPLERRLRNFFHRK